MGSAPCKGFKAAGWGCGWRFHLGCLCGTGAGPGQPPLLPPLPPPPPPLPPPPPGFPPSPGGLGGLCPSPPGGPGRPPLGPKLGGPGGGPPPPFQGLVVLLDRVGVGLLLLGGLVGVLCCLQGLVVLLD